MDMNAEVDAFIGIDIDVEPPESAESARDKQHRLARSQAPASASKPKSGTSSSRKRPRPSSSSTGAAAAASAKKRPKKPKPPPNPPSSLVSLLQKDASVRSYFLSLQENLDYDVDKWKHEASKWKRLAATAPLPSSSSSQPKKNGTNNNNNNNNGTTEKKKKAKPRPKRGAPKPKPKDVQSKSNNNTNVHPKKLERINENDEGSAIPITEDIFADLLNDDDDDSSSSQESVPIPNFGFDAKSPLEFSTPEPAPATSQGQNNSQAKNKAEIARRSHILEKLKEAKVCLDVLGVSLVEIEVKKTVTVIRDPIELDVVELRKEASGDVNSGTPTFERDPTPVVHDKAVGNLHDAEEKDDNASNSPSTVIERTLHRQSDELVAAEMMASLRNLIKASLLIGSDLLNASSGATNNNVDQSDDDINDDDRLMKEAGENNPLLNNDELMHLCRLRRRYHPFCREGEQHVPSVYYSIVETDKNVANFEGNRATSDEMQSSAPLSEHPASIVLKHLMNVLSIMDTYCGDNLRDDEWNAIFACDGNNYNQIDGENNELRDEEMAILQTGMRNRCRLTERVLSSLDVEITRVWALTDRASNLDTPTIHFHPADILDMNDPENLNIHNQPYGAKSYNRLSNLVEKVGQARIAAVLHHRRGNLQKAAELVVGFIISSAPSLGAEQYPKLSPVLSMCILEALLAPKKYVPINTEGLEKANGSKVSDRATGWFEETLRYMLTTSSREDGVSNDTSMLLLLRAIAHPVHVAASIWRERSFCADDRIRDVAVVELAAYKRAQRLGTWLTNPSFASMTVEPITKLGAEILSLAVSTSLNCKDGDIDSSKMQILSGMCCTTSLLTLGDNDRIIQLCDKMLLNMKDPSSKENNEKSGSDEMIQKTLYLLPACCSAYSSIMYRKWENLKLGNVSGRHTAAAFTVEDNFSPILDSVTRHVNTDDWSNIDIIIQCCVLLGDGRSLQRLANRVLPKITQMVITKENDKMTTNQHRLVSRLMTSLIDAGEIPTVRVINLERRPDRALDFMGCTAHKEQLLVIKGPGKMRRKGFIAAQKNSKTSFIGRDDDGECPGDFAFDGQCSRDELEEQLLQRLDGKGTLSDFVKAKWRPSELKAFDRDARDGFELVHTSMTEKACSLSHIASWMGVESTLSEISAGTRGECDSEWYQKKLTRMFKISGFARGAALLHENEDMDPAPVCVILEDDAVLSDRFAERLASLLEELPRDFHFCSLGYSRPRAAPMVEYSTNLGIPSCLWYLTGYILSLEGARHLIKSLPVTGPVDSWIGLKMCSNWDNKFGDMMGVGKYTKAKTKLPARKDLAKIMNFRAFAALVPLCAQKVGMSTIAAVTRKGWRDRDTDITYSG